MNRLLSLSLASSLLLGVASAQSYYMPSNTPSTGTCNVFPFGQSSFVYQTLATATDLGTSPVLNLCDIGFTPCSGSGTLRFATIEITLAQTAATTLSTTFASNLSQNPQVVLKATNYEWNVTSNKFNRIGFDKSYLYIAGTTPSLVIQIVATGVSRTGISTSFHRDGTHLRMYALNWTGSPPTTGRGDRAALKFEVLAGSPDVNTFGTGCTGSNGRPTLSVSGDGKIGGSFGISVANCVASTPVLHALGLTRSEPRIDLGILGAPGCFLYHSLDVIVGGVSSTSGVYSWKVAIPNSKNLVCARVYTQVAPFDANANSWGSTTSNYGRLLVGN